MFALGSHWDMELRFILDNDGPGAFIYIGSQSEWRFIR